MQQPAFDLMTRVRWTVQALYVRQHAIVAVLSSVMPRVDDGDLSDVLRRHLGETRVQIRRLRCVGQILELDFADLDDLQTLDELRSFAHDLAQGLLHGSIDAVAIKALMKLAVVEHGLYSYARTVCQDTAEWEIAGLLLASEEEEERFVADLSALAERESLGLELAMTESVRESESFSF